MSCIETLSLLIPFEIIHMLHLEGDERWNGSLELRETYIQLYFSDISKEASISYLLHLLLWSLPSCSLYYCGEETKNKQMEKLLREQTRNEIQRGGELL